MEEALSHLDIMHKTPTKLQLVSISWRGTTYWCDKFMHSNISLTLNIARESHGRVSQLAWTDMLCDLVPKDILRKAGYLVNRRRGHEQGL